LSHWMYILYFSGNNILYFHLFYFIKKFFYIVVIFDSIFFPFGYIFEKPTNASITRETNNGTDYGLNMVRIFENVKLTSTMFSTTSRSFVRHLVILSAASHVQYFGNGIWETALLRGHVTIVMWAVWGHVGVFSHTFREEATGCR